MKLLCKFSSLAHSGQLPAGWASTKAPSGQMYYWHVDDPQGTKTWEMPRGVKVERMRIFVKPKPRGKRATLDVKPSCKIGEVKAMLARYPGWNVTVEMQRLRFAGNELRNDRTLSYYGIQNEDSVNLTVPVGFEEGTHALCTPDDVFGEGSFHHAQQANNNNNNNVGQAQGTPAPMNDVWALLSLSSSSSSSSSSESSSLESGGAK